MSKRFTITAALPYTNGPIHIGHLAGVYIPADLYSRFLRIKGNDVLFVCGSDEHGVPITLKAKKDGVDPQDIVDKYHKIIKDSFIDFGISFDNYSRTSSKIHHKTASDFFTKLNNNNEFTKIESEQFYDESENQFLADRFIIGTCPKCHYMECYGDQCEKCGTSHNAIDLINPKSSITGLSPKLKKTTHWYLKLDSHQSFLEEWILKSHKLDWKTNVYGQCKSWLDDGLKPRAVTRDLEWGVPVPLDSANGKVLYVWFDAPIGYISSTIEWANNNNKNWEKYWKDPETELIHFIGKDNIVFHCIIFPAMLKAEGSYILPKNVPANEFLNLEGDKISTSKNWAVWLPEYLIDFPDQQDVLRYVLTSNAPETKDNDFTWKDFQAKNNNELVAIFGNFINRVVVLTNKYYDGTIPNKNKFLDIDNEVLKSIDLSISKIEKSIYKFRFREACNELINIARIGNKYLADQEPWKTIKEDEIRVETVMYVSLQISAILSVISEPFLPNTSSKLQNILNSKAHLIEWSWDNLCKKNILVNTGTNINKAELLFSKIEDKEIDFQIEKLNASKKSKAIISKKKEINYTDFSKLNLNIGTILEAKKIEKSKKLLLLKVDIKNEIRSIVSAIAKSYDSSKIIGVKVVVLTNLESKVIAGVQSQGMVLLTKDENDVDVFLSPDDISIENGLSIS
ncbi:methionine--tRNA ligase [Flavobacteriaceae bacterium]|nr:methionine--tRNA ligase [Flavobacteriaceae bacterium]MDC1491973.1 methionine--tRNA ligase [Flavobacteriaceae bacterium]